MVARVCWHRWLAGGGGRNGGIGLEEGNDVCSVPFLLNFFQTMLLQTKGFSNPLRAIGGLQAASRLVNVSQDAIHLPIWLRGLLLAGASGASQGIWSKLFFDGKNSFNRQRKNLLKCQTP